LPVGLNPRVDRPAAQKFFVERGMHENPIFSIDSANRPDGQITQKSVNPDWKKYSAFQK
jgi:hypothetical protein